VSGNRCLDMVPGNRCRETGVLIPFGNRCQETGVLNPFGNRCRETGVLIPFGNRCRETVVWIQLSLSIECLETDVKVSNVTCTYLWRESVWIQVSGKLLISIKLFVVYLHIINECLSCKFHPYSILTGHTKVESVAY
jgi:hypothetical protein